MKYNFSLLFLVLFGSLQAQVLQNVVRNPSFEQYRQQYPKDLGQISLSTYWGGANLAGADYYHERSEGSNVAVPRNKMGRTKAKTGRGYAGVYAYTSRYSKRDYREYVQVKLKHPLKRGETYCIKAQLYLAEASNRALGALGAGASRFPMDQEDEAVLQNIKFTYLFNQDRSPLDQRQWVEVQGDYVAEGGENFLILGNFQDDRSTKVTGAIEVDSFRNPHVDFAYYFIDDVCLTSQKSNFTCNCGSFEMLNTQRREKIVLDVRLNRKEYRLNQVDILEQVQFERGNAIFLEGAKEELDNLAKVMEMNPTYEIEISGHTSNKGDPRENHFLSKKRAKAVYDYLVASGVHRSRLKYRGYGQARPIALNDSSAGRAKNERIQIKLLKK